MLTVVFRLVKLHAGTDETAPAHYTADPEPTAEAAVPVTTVTADPTLR